MIDDSDKDKHISSTTNPSPDEEISNDDLIRLIYEKPGQEDRSNLFNTGRFDAIGEACDVCCFVADAHKKYLDAIQILKTTGKRAPIQTIGCVSRSDLESQTASPIERLLIEISKLILPTKKDGIIIPVHMWKIPEGLNPPLLRPMINVNLEGTYNIEADDFFTYFVLSQKSPVLQCHNLTDEEGTMCGQTYALENVLVSIKASGVVKVETRLDYDAPCCGRFTKLQYEIFDRYLANQKKQGKDVILHVGPAKLQKVLKYILAGRDMFAEDRLSICWPDGRKTNLAVAAQIDSSSFFYLCNECGNTIPAIRYEKDFKIDPRKKD